jgi:ketosteroid isomerase-like protein
MAEITRRLLGASALGAAMLTACTPPPATQDETGGLTSDAFAAWLDRYGAAWSARDAAAAGQLFTEDASYHEMPFDASKQGRAAIEAYWASVTEPQSDIVFSYDVITASGDTGVAHWNARFNAGGAAIELDGVFVIAFAEDLATARSLREWWHVRTGAAE